MSENCRQVGWNNKCNWYKKYRYKIYRHYENFLGKQMSSQKILVVDDDRDISKLLKIILTSVGWDVVIADTGKQAQNLYQQHQDSISIIILDIQMPELDGISFIKWLRQECDCQTPILVSTGISRTDVEFLIKDYTYVDLINKPYNMDILMKKLDQCILHNDTNNQNNKTL